uniref:TerD domain-containing protein n=1 Tax=Ascaris lumbricoides TaxID=6252 RepID=A0A0M3I3U9_ASCLU
MVHGALCRCLEDDNGGTFGDRRMAEMSKKLQFACAENGWVWSVGFGPKAQPSKQNEPNVTSRLAVQPLSAHAVQRYARTVLCI